MRSAGGERLPDGQLPPFGAGGSAVRGSDFHTK